MVWVSLDKMSIGSKGTNWLYNLQKWYNAFNQKVKNEDKKRINDANQTARSQGGEEAELGQTPGGPRVDLRALEDTDPICSEIRESLLTAYSVGAPGRVEELHRRMAERRRELRESLQGAS